MRDHHKVPDWGHRAITACFPGSFDGGESFDEDSPADSIRWLSA